MVDEGSLAVYVDSLENCILLLRSSIADHFMKFMNQFLGFFKSEGFRRVFFRTREPKFSSLSQIEKIVVLVFGCPR